ncbi:MAG TPA: pyridoxal phosphate-dependent aminotransferase [Candidatus Baltobacteraceae bacterium]|nr:pyridoxal phosphate-dependent aminotransferase [Candidatus Baltobacteraceae bacterium]
MNPRVLEIPGSLIRKIAARKRPSSIDLGLGEPSLMPNAEHFDFAMRYVAEHGAKYTANAGDPALRESIARYYHYPDMHRMGNVCVTTGSQEAMYVTIKTLLDPSQDELLVVEPAFPSYVKMAALENVVYRTVEMREEDDFAFDAARILAAVTPATRAIVICSPCNPTGRVLSGEQARLLVTGLEKRHGKHVWLIHDEIYREQTFTPDAAYLAELYPQTIVTNSVSKSNALTGMRLGWILAPESFIEHAIKAHAWVTSCADTFSQAVALHVFTTLEGVREHAPWYREQRSVLLAALEKSGLRFVVPEGSFYACIALPEGVSSLDAANDLVERHDVLAIPGIAFGPSLEGWLRLSWVCPPQRLRDGIARIADYCATMADQAKPSARS